ncbi:MAG TPA: hypothetical protein VNV82_06810 [Bryobacteraceae bacterium]|jgi:hypothetical protein|nr:hypothetical protein [Bryobacteraceae bacterium]
MTNLRRFAVLLTLPIATWAADPALLKLVMPDAKVIAGIQVDQTKNSLFGQYILSHMQVDDAGFKSFIAQTGFDPRRDVREIMVASNWESNSAASRWLVMARGAFDLGKIATAAHGTGISTTNFQGVNILVHSSSAKPDVENAVAFFDSTYAVMGDLASVEAAIGRQKSGAVPGNQLLSKVNDLSSKNDFWFATLVPVSEFADAMPDPNLSGAMKGNLLAAINEASGGIRFGDMVNISAEATTRSEKDAQALVDVVKFVAGMVQLNRQNNAAAGQVATLLDTLDCKAAGNVTTLSLAIPELQLEQMLEMMRQQSRQATKKPALPQGN